MDERTRYDRALKRVKDIKGFYVHVLVYAAVMTGIFLIDLVTPGGPWFYWPLFGWGIGLVIHGLSVFAFEGLWGAAWEERKARELMAKER
jgi:hypothetical protein